MKNEINKGKENHSQTKNYKQYLGVVTSHVSVTLLKNAADALKTVESSGLIPSHSELMESVFLTRLDFEDALMLLKTKKHCTVCDGDLYCSDVADYNYVCCECDENFYEFEVKD